MSTGISAEYFRLDFILGKIISCMVQQQGGTRVLCIMFPIKFSPITNAGNKILKPGTKNNYIHVLIEGYIYLDMDILMHLSIITIQNKDTHHLQQQTKQNFINFPSLKAEKSNISRNTTYNVGVHVML